MHLITVHALLVDKPKLIFIFIFILFLFLFLFFSIRPPQRLLPVLGPLEPYMAPTLDAALLNSQRVGADLGQTSVVTTVNS